MNALTLDIPVLETERLRLRMLSIDDFEEECAFYATERSRGVGGPKEPREVWRILTMFIGHWIVNGYGFWALEDKETGRYMGRAGCLNPCDWPEAEIGWTLMAHAEGKGLAYEAATAVRRFAYQTLGWSTAISLIKADNTRSAALAQRLGCVREGIFQHAIAGEVPIWRHPGPEALA